MSKTELDSLLWLDTTSLRRMRFLESGRTGVLTWTRKGSGESSRISISIHPFDELPYLQVIYTASDYFSGEKKDYDYRIPLDRTPCNYGGMRYWFRCPLVVSGVYCGRRVRKLYMQNSYFGCRTCHELTYSSQKENPTYRHGFFRIMGDTTRADAVRETIKVPYYKGKPTRKMRRLLRYSHSEREMYEAEAALMKGLTGGV